MGGISHRREAYGLSSVEVVGDEESAVSGVEWIGEGKFIGGAGG